MIPCYSAEKVLGCLKMYTKIIKNKLKIPMLEKKRSLNLAISVAIILSENLRQINFKK